MMTDTFSISDIRAHLLPAEHWRSCPPATDRAAWNALLREPLHAARAQWILERAEPLQTKSHPVLPLTGYADFIQSGERQAYETLYFQRREDLALLSLAYAFSGDAVWMEPLVNLLGAICEETSWAVPAHEERAHPEDAIPSFARPSVDLFACESAAALAECVHLLAGALETPYPNLVERVRREIDRRVLRPFEERDDFVWLTGHNNWTPWCISSVLIAASNTVTGPERLARIFHRALLPLARFLDQYPADGCDEEGPMYWQLSPGVLLLALEVLYERTGGCLNFYSHPKIRAMGRYIVQMHLGKGNAYSYSDAFPVIGSVAARIHRFGERLKEPGLCNAAQLALRNWSVTSPPDPRLGFQREKRCCGDLLHALRELFWIPAQERPPTPVAAEPVWYPESQLLIAHAGAHQGEGLGLGIKGGHNGISHNHNDLGSFVVYADGSPVIVDVGRSVYTRQNFGSNEERYGLWWNAGRGHDVLMINGTEQPPGGMHRAEVLDLCTEGERVSVTYELGRAYPEDCGLLSWQRQAVLERGGAGRLILGDRVRLCEAVVLSMPLFTPRHVTLEPGRAVFSLPGEEDVCMTWDPEKLSVRLAELETCELPLIEAWGGHLQRLLLESVQPLTEQEWFLVFAPAARGERGELFFGVKNSIFD